MTPGQHFMTIHIPVPRTVQQLSQYYKQTQLKLQNSAMLTLRE